MYTCSPASMLQTTCPLATSGAKYRALQPMLLHQSDSFRLWLHKLHSSGRASSRSYRQTASVIDMEVRNLLSQSCAEDLASLRPSAYVYFSMTALPVMFYCAKRLHFISLQHILYANILALAQPAPISPPCSRFKRVMPAGLTIPSTGDGCSATAAIVHGPAPGPSTKVQRWRHTCGNSQSWGAAQ
jgi:hypothetical protein